MPNIERDFPPFRYFRSGEGRWIIIGKYGRQFDPEKHPRDEATGRFTDAGGGETVAIKQSVAKLIGVPQDSDWDDIWAEGIWFRSQPRGLGLNHRSEFSSGELDSGVHVMQTLAQVVGQEGRWAMEDAGYEIVVIRGPKSLADTGDVEGWTLPQGEGEIIGRFDFDPLAIEYDE